MARHYYDPAQTCTLEDFVAIQYSDEITYYNFSIIEVVDGIKLLDHNLVEEYISELESLCVNCDLNNEQYRKYRFSPDLLAYDVYGTTQIDFVILMVNNMIDPKEFDLRTIKLPYASKLKAFMSSVYNANLDYIKQNRADNNVPMVI